jgi:hypothetical protein
MAAETEALAVADACLLAYLATDSEDSKDDQEAGPSGAGAEAERHDLSPPPPPPIAAAQVTIPDTLATIL